MFDVKLLLSGIALCGFGFAAREALWLTMPGIPGEPIRLVGYAAIAAWGVWAGVRLELLVEAARDKYIP